MLLFLINIVIFFKKLHKDNLNFGSKFFFFANLRLSLVFKMSLIFGKISASCPYKLCPYSKKECARSFLSTCFYLRQRNKRPCPLVGQ